MAMMNSVKKIMNKVNNFVDSPSGKKKTGQFLDKTEKFATGKLGADKASKIRKVRTMVEGRLGTGSDRPNHPGSTPPICPIAPSTQMGSLVQEAGQGIRVLEASSRTGYRVSSPGPRRSLTGNRATGSTVSTHRERTGIEGTPVG